MDRQIATQCRKEEWIGKVGKELARADREGFPPEGAGIEEILEFR